MVLRTMRVVSMSLVMAWVPCMGWAQAASSIGTWAAAPVSAVAGPEAGKADETLRQIIHTSIGGEVVSVTLSNEFGTEPLRVDAASIGVSEGKDRIGGQAKLTFDGKARIVIAPGAMVRSDRTRLEVRPLSDLAVSLLIPAQPMGKLTEHAFANTTNYVAPGDQVAAAALVDAREMGTWRYLKQVAVDEEDGNGVGAVVCLGASITDGAHSSKDANRRWPDVLARRLQMETRTRRLGILNEGIGGNRILHDGTGPSALARFDRDVLQGLTPHGQNYLIVMEGTNDIGHATDPNKPYDIVSAEDLIAGYTELARRAHARKIRIYGGTLTPFAGATYASAAGEAMRVAVNRWIRTTKEFDGFIDFDRVALDPSDPTRLRPDFDSGDHLHPSDAGYKAMGEAIDLKLFMR